MKEIFEYIDNMNPWIIILINLGLYLIVSFFGRRYLKKKGEL